MELESLTPRNIIAPPAFQKLISSPETTVADILEQNITFRLFRTGDEYLISFFVSHVQELLNLTFFFDSRTQSDLSAKAFAILEHSQPALTVAMLKDQKLHKVACDVLSGTEPNTLILSRLSSLTLGALCVDPNSVIKTCGYLFQLISYFFEPSVLALFETMSINDPEFASLQKWLIKVGFADLIQREIDSFSPYTKTPSQLNYLSHEALNLCGYLKIVSLCASSDKLSPYFTTQSLVSALNHDIGALPQFIEDARWEALSAVYCKRTLESMRGLFQSAVELISPSSDDTFELFSQISPKSDTSEKTNVSENSNTTENSNITENSKVSENPKTSQTQDIKYSKRGTRAVSAAAQILAGMIQLDPVLRPFIVMEKVPLIAAQLMFELPDNTFLHKSLRTLILASLEQPDTRSSFYGALPFLLTGFETKNPNLLASLLLIIGEAAGLGNRDSKVANILKDIPGFIQCVRTKLAYHNALLAASYGGMTPIGSTPIESASVIAENAMHIRAW